VSNQRNGTSGKTVLTEDGPLRIDVPRHREGRPSSKTRRSGSTTSPPPASSGTTDKPKGAMLTHRNFAHASAQRALWLDEQLHNTELVTLPISHLAGMTTCVW